uniref:Uncharacterized protein n=1 Tax=Acrobeloides nanus TaxID=290746 RepID=A0A914CKP5_9BILA
MVTMTVVTVPMKEIVQKNSASYAKEPNSVAMIIGNAFLEVFNAMERTTAMMARMKYTYLYEKSNMPEACV